MTQKDALDILKTGANVFLTGEPGSGKTHTINAYVGYLRSCGIEPAITASTGIAATHIGGMTIHSWSGIGVADLLSEEEAVMIAGRKKIKKRLDRTRILIIDEVSMLSGATLSMIDAVCRAGRRADLPFGGMQAVLVGDFFQLPPVSRNGKKTPFAYESDSWRALNPVMCYLTEQYRQDDPRYLAALSAIRANGFTAGHREDLFRQKENTGHVPDNVPRMFSHNADVDRINAERLTRLPGQSATFYMQAHGPAPLVEMLKKNCLSPESLVLKKGAAVMCTKNNFQKGYVNGTLGIIREFDADSTYPIIETHRGSRILMEPMEWVIEEQGKTRARVAQIPLRLAWAMTVHKSQGMSMDAAVVDLSDAFEYGQGYVALSRVRRLSGLYLLGANERAFMVSRDILEKDREFRAASNAAEKKLNSISQEDMDAKHKRFLWQCGGTMPKVIAADARDQESSHANTRAGKDAFENIRKLYPNAYRAWSDADDSALRDFFNQEKPANPAKLAKHFGRKPGAIYSRLIKLGLIAYNPASGLYETTITVD